MHNLGGHQNLSAMDPEFATERKYVQSKIFEFLMQRKPHVQEVHELVRRLDEGLLRTAVSKGEYMNLDTLESRLHVLIRKIPMPNQAAQRSQFADSSTPIGAMIPTPGSVLNGCQQSQTSSVNTSGNSTMATMGGERAGGQLIPTPGFGSNNNHHSMSMESANSGVGVSTVDSSLASQQPL